MKDEELSTRRPLTVVMVGHKGLPARSGGIEQHVEALAIGLAGRGVRVVSFDRRWYVGDASPPGSVNRRWSSGIYTKHLDALTHTLTAIVRARSEMPDVVHLHGVGPALLAPLARLLHRKARIIVTVHNLDRRHRKWGTLARLALRIGEACACWGAHSCIVVSRELERYFWAVYRRRAVVIVNGATIRRGAPTSLITPFGLATRRYILMATRLVPDKNVDQAINAHALLSYRRPDLTAQFPLVIVGRSAFTDSYERVLRSLAARSPSVRLLGEQSGETLAALQEHAAVHFSIASVEGMSLSLLEAMAAGRPAIVSDIPENRDVTAGIAPTVPAGITSALVDVLEELLDGGDEVLDQIGSALFQRAIEHHDWGRIVDATLAHYRETLVRCT